MNDNGKFKKKKVYFAQVSNEALRDKHLSLKAKGLFALIQSYITIENFTLYKNKLKSECKEGEKAFESTWKELKDNGYLIQYKQQDLEGKFYYEYELMDMRTIPPKKEGVVKDTVEKAPSGKGGQYNNTDSNNTNLNNTYASDTYSNEEEKDFQQAYNNFSECKDKEITLAEKKALKQLINDSSIEIVLKAIDVMAERAEKPSISYLKATLKDWYTKGWDTLEKVLEGIAKHELNNTKANENKNKKIKALAEEKTTYGVKIDNFNDYEQRTYDFNSLEKKLLGWEE